MFNFIKLLLLLLLISDALANQESVEYINRDVIEGEKFYLFGDNVFSDKSILSWTQTCGEPASLSFDDSSMRFFFLAPKSATDLSYCFSVVIRKGTGEVILSQFNFRVVAPTLEVYIDPASIPALNHLLYIIDTYEENASRARFVAWSRIDVSHNSSIKKLLNIETFPLKNKNDISDEMVAAIKDKSLKTERLNIELFTNAKWSMNHISTIARMLSNIKSGARISKIRIYDDGSSEYIDLYNWIESGGTASDLVSGKEALVTYLHGDSDVIPDFMRSKYNWHEIYNVDYYFIRPEYLRLESRLNGLYEHLHANLKRINYNIFSSLSEKKQQLFLDVVGFDRVKLVHDYGLSEDDNLIFTGTTTWNVGHERQFYADQQINVLRNVKYSTGALYPGKKYDFFFKGHPAGKDINKRIESAFDGMISIPSNISFEVLMMTGMLPDKIGGIASSLYLSLPRDKISFIVFSSTDDISNLHDAINSPLVQIMIKLNIISEHSVVFWSDLPDCSTGTCVKRN